MKHSVITPAYNRSKQLEKLYSAMLRLNYPKSDFEWVIVNDGSTDGTDAVCQKIVGDKIINTIYVRLEKNSGIHVAQNRGITNATGLYVTRIDTDDYLLPDSLLIYDKYLASIKETGEKRYCGVVGICLNEDGTSRSSPLPLDYIDCTGIFGRDKYGLTGDRNYCILRDVLLCRLLPEYPDTKYVPEGSMWMDIDKEFVTRFINEPISVCKNNSIDSMGLQCNGNAKTLSNFLSGFYGAYLTLAHNFRQVSLKSKLRICAVYLTYGKVTQKNKDKTWKKQAASQLPFLPKIFLFFLRPVAFLIGKKKHYKVIWPATIQP